MVLRTEFENASLRLQSIRIDTHPQCECKHIDMYMHEKQIYVCILSSYTFVSPPIPPRPGITQNRCRSDKAAGATGPPANRGWPKRPPAVAGRAVAASGVLRLSRRGSTAGTVRATAASSPVRSAALPAQLTGTPFRAQVGEAELFALPAHHLRVRNRRGCRARGRSSRGRSGRGRSSRGLSGCQPFPVQPCALVVALHPTRAWWSAALGCRRHGLHTNTGIVPAAARHPNVNVTIACAGAGHKAKPALRRRRCLGG